ncbi:hypothetical protein P4S95_22740 [Aneurinibacillus aneurinilyticus]|nr:hypothetical protein [Aneurinibacillus aneurinilyticus]
MSFFITDKMKLSLAELLNVSMFGDILPGMKVSVLDAHMRRYIG